MAVHGGRQELLMLPAACQGLPPTPAPASSLMTFRA